MKKILIISCLIISLFNISFSVKADSYFWTPYYVDTLLEEITKNNYEGLNAWNNAPESLEVFRNMIYAKNGYIFKNEYWNDFFREESWYTGRYDNIEDVPISKQEQKLIDEIMKREKRLLK